MAEPARASVPDTGPDKDRPGRPGPRDADWACVRGLVITAAEGAGRAAAELAEQPGDPRALHRARILADAVTYLAGVVRGRAIDEAVLADAEERAYARGVADGRAARRRLGAVPGAG